MARDLSAPIIANDGLRFSALVFALHGLVAFDDEAPPTCAHHDVAQTTLTSEVFAMPTCSDVTQLMVTDSVVNEAVSMVDELLMSEATVFAASSDLSTVAIVTVETCSE